MKRYTINPPTESELTSRGFTKKIKLNEDITVNKLIDYGFTNHHKPSLHLSRMIDDNISFNLSVSKKTLRITNIDVLDESFLQPYDYQYYLQNDNNHKHARKVFDKVDEILNKLQNDGIITGYKRGMYV